MDIPASAIRTSYRVPYADTDMMGVVYYGNYLTFFERARNELMRATGRTYADMENGGAMLPVVEAHVQYRSPARYDDLLTVAAWVEEARGCRIKIRCAVLRGDTLLAEGHTVHVCIDAATRKPIRIPPTSSPAPPPLPPTDPLPPSHIDKIPFTSSQVRFASSSAPPPAANVAS